jgi:hypothetical protein
MMNEPDRYWRIIEFCDWENCKNEKEIGQKLMESFSPEDLVKMEEFYHTRLDEIKTILENHAEAKTGDRHNYYGLGDDGFWDLRAHIIGLGKQFYQSVLKDPEIAKKMADDGDFKENFGYIIQHTKKG